MAIADRVQNDSSKRNFHVEIIERVGGISEILEAVQEYLSGWSKERIVNLQKIDGGWAPFDESQRPLCVVSTGAVLCNRDAIHRQCIALREASIPLTPELVELDEFFYNACKLIEDYEKPALGRRTPEIRTPLPPSHQDFFANW